MTSAMPARALLMSCLGLSVVLAASSCGTTEVQSPGASPAPNASAATTDSTLANSRRLLEEGRHTFRRDVLTLHRALAGAKHGGVGDGVSPRAPLDGRFGTLRDVLERYDRLFRLGLTEVEKTDLGEYVKSL